MLLYCEQITPRLRYIVDFIGEELGSHIHLTADREIFETMGGPKINYSKSRLVQNEVYIRPEQLLFETSIEAKTITCFQVNGRPAFFKSTGSDFPFDIFAASFYLLSRYEEYLPHRKNEYGCYAHENSLAFREGFVHLPLVNYWIEDFKTLLLSKWPSLETARRKFQFLPTYDIDSAWSYQHKGWLRNLGGLLKSVLQLEFGEVGTRLAVLAKKKQDPYDAYGWLNAMHERYGLHPIYFLLMAKKKSANDKNISPGEIAFQSLIRALSAKAETGIHPSWQSHDQPTLLHQEIELLQVVTGKPVVNSRQHYIRWELPLTFRRLIECGIRNDFSMGYSTINGFRASVASCFYWYDLPADTITTLRLWPFCFMDSTAIFETRSSDTDAFEQLQKLVREIKNVTALMITIWHNNYLGSDPKYLGWRKRYEQFLEVIHNQVR